MLLSKPNVLKLSDCHIGSLQTLANCKSYETVVNVRNNGPNINKYRNKTRQLIRASKRKHFSESISKSKDTKHIWAHLRTLNGYSKASNNRLPEELIIDNECITNSAEIAQKLNTYFSSIAIISNQNDNEATSLNTEKISQCVNNKIPNDTFFTIPFITPEQVTNYINKLDCSKTTGLDGVWPRILKIAACAISPSVAKLINKSTAT